MKGSLFPLVVVTALPFLRMSPIRVRPLFLAYSLVNEPGNVKIDKSLGLGFFHSFNRLSRFHP